MKVPAQKIDQAYDKWFATYTNLQKGELVHSVTIWNDFWTFVSGYKDYPRRDFDGDWFYNVTAEMNRKLDMVLGPYCKTIMRMWFCQGELTMKQVLGFKLGKAWLRHDTASKITGRTAFMKFLDGNPPLPLNIVQCYCDGRYEIWDVTDRAYEQIDRLCNSPHWCALVKAHYAREE